MDDDSRLLGYIVCLPTPITLIGLQRAAAPEQSPRYYHQCTHSRRSSLYEIYLSRPSTEDFNTDLIFVPPTFPFRALPLAKKHTSILVLACGDIGWVFYSVSTRSAAYGSFPKLRVMLNDNEPYGIAPKINILWLLPRANLDNSSSAMFSDSSQPVRSVMS